MLLHRLHNQPFNDVEYMTSTISKGIPLGWRYCMSIRNSRSLVTQFKRKVEHYQVSK